MEISWRWVISICLVMSIAVGIAFVLTRAAAGPNQVSDPQSSPKEFGAFTPDELKSYVFDLAGNLEHHLKAATGDRSDCVNDCIYPSLNRQLEGIAVVCDAEVYPELVEDPAYDPKLHEPVTSALLQTCEDIDAIIRELGPPEGQPKWRNQLSDPEVWQSRLRIATKQLTDALAAEKAKR